MKNKKKVVYTTGVFDLIHSGHISTLQRALSFGSYLIVGIQDDKSVFVQKGAYPVMSSDERKVFLESLPFVNECVIYDDIDQRAMLEKIKPDVMAQTEEWTGQTDRTEIIDYLNSNNIILELMSIKKTISSTQIKKRVIENADLFRNDIDILRSRLDIISFDSLVLFEKFDPIRTERLVKKILEEKTFFNPITVAAYQGKYIVIDGANRLEALRRLGIKNIFVYIVDYCNSQHVELKNNAHFLHIERDEFCKLLDKHGIKYTFIKKEEINNSLNSKDICVIVQENDNYMVLSDKKYLCFVDFLNKLVNVYVGKYEVYRLSELSQDAQHFGLKIIFPLFTIDNIVELTQKDVYLQSGITWHSIKNNIIHFSLPLSILKDNTKEESKYFLKQEIEKKIANKKIRYYPSNVYICNEWE
jgi:cytidyltransferase-like protein